MTRHVRSSACARGLYNNCIIIVFVEALLLSQIAVGVSKLLKEKLISNNQFSTCVCIKNRIKKIIWL